MTYMNDPRNFPGGVTGPNAQAPAPEASQPATAQPAYKLPLYQAAQWQSAITCAEREPFKLVSLEAQTVLAVHDLIAATHPAAPAQPLPDRDTSRPAEQQGLFRKFDVRRTDGSDQPGGKHHGCEYFVLDVDHDPHAKPALAAYADAVEATHPELAKDMRKRYGLAASTQPAAPAQGEREALIKALAECRDAFPEPTRGTPADDAYTEAMGDPLSVPGFIRAALAASTQLAADKEQSHE